KTEMPDYFQLSAYLPGQISSQSEKQTEPDLIDKFLDKPAEHIQIDKTEEEQSPETSPADEYPESSFTETLAKIYLKQGKYEKALEIFNKLLLKYPEKSIYFADQIRFLDKLIHHLKK
ncbi:MAG: tetratricopeptide repeat protein, partial [Bacteroidales bacterium]